MKRRKFIKDTAVVGAGAFAASKFGMTDLMGLEDRSERKGKEMSLPVVISTWSFGLRANDVAWKLLKNGENSLDSVEQGVKVIEDDPTITSVGYGGLPDENMTVTLDSCIMDWRGNCGAVGCIENIKNPVSVARKVMERTTHIMLVGRDARDFAVAQGFKPTDLLTDEARKRWLEWKENPNRVDNWLFPHDMNDLDGNHDTIGMLALDQKGRISAAVTTSGLAWKIPGRVGDSGIIGAGIYADGKVGASASTGLGEANMRIVGSYLVVERMRGGMNPQEACEAAIKRAIEVHRRMIMSDKGFQLAYIALNTKGETGGAAIRKGFQYALYRDGTNKLYDSKYLYVG